MQINIKQNNGWCLPIAPTQHMDVADMTPRTMKTAMIELLMISAMGRSCETSLLLRRRICVFLLHFSTCAQVFIYYTEDEVNYYPVDMNDFSSFVVL